jgi:hypothetical protein
LNPCNGICTRHKAIKPFGGRYVEGQKRCTQCQIFIWWDGIFCVCCGNKLRTKVRNKSQQLRKKMEKLKLKRSAHQLSLLTIKSDR